jgi:hypothetical protein
MMRRTTECWLMLCSSREQKYQGLKCRAHPRATKRTIRYQRKFSFLTEENVANITKLLVRAYFWHITNNVRVWCVTWARGRCSFASLIVH